MIIEAGTPESEKVKIFDKDGNPIPLVYFYDTETKLTKYYDSETDANGRLGIKCTDWETDPKNGKQTRIPITKTEVLEGSYATIDGQKV